MAQRAMSCSPLVGYDVYRIVDERGGEVKSGSQGGLLSVHLDQGRHTLRLARRRTTAELAGMALTLVGLLGFGLLRHA